MLDDGAVLEAARDDAAALAEPDVGVVGVEDDGVVAVDEEPGGWAHHLRNGAGDEHRRGVVKGRGRMPRARRDDGAPRPVEVDDVRGHGALFDPASHTLGIAAYDDDGVERAGEVRLPT